MLKVSKQQPRRVLLVDDNADVVDALSGGLVKKGYGVNACKDPSTALEEFVPGMYDVALLDVRRVPSRNRP